MSAVRWRLGSVPFLNERPLTVAFDGRDDVALERLPPGPLSDRLAAGEFDAALIPVAEQLRLGLEPVGALGIACRGAVDSVQVWHDGDRGGLTRILVPAHSRSSVMLLRLLLPEWGCPDAELVPTDYPRDLAEPPGEPALIIGDAALRCLGTGRPATDLGAAWYAWTGCPFVFARWTARAGLPAADRDRLETELLAAANAGVPQAEAIARAEGPARNIPVARATGYLRETMCYHLDGEALAGQLEFARRARRAGLLAG